MQPELSFLTAFTDDPAGGNPAGVWIGDALPATPEMQRIAAEVGYSETAFLAPAGDRQWTTRYFSPEAEVSFCGHATIAAAVAVSRVAGTGTHTFHTAAGAVPVDVEPGASGVRATLTSVAPEQCRCPPGLLDDALAAFGWSVADLDPGLPPQLSYAGAWHLVLALAERATLAGMAYDFEALRGATAAHGITTVQVVWREDGTTFHSRNPFPVGGVVEDPATGAAAAALGAYLRAHDFVTPPADVVVHQGHDLGRPSRIDVHVPADGGIRVTGTAVPITR